MTKEFKARQIFIEEARDELLPELENALLELGGHPDDPALINRVFRALHTLKGSGAMFGFDRLSGLAHEMETVFDNVRNGLYRVTNPLVELTLTAKDQFHLLVNDPESVSAQTIQDLARAFRDMDADKTPAGSAQDGRATADSPADPQSWAVYHIRFKPRPGIFSTGTNPLFLLDELTELGVTRVIAHAGGIPLLEAMDPEACYVWWDILLATDRGINAIKDVFIFVEGDCELTIDVIADHVQPGHESPVFEELGRRLLEEETIGLETLRQAFIDKIRSTDGKDIVAENIQRPAATGGPDRTLTDRRSGKDRRGEPRSISSMRVQAVKLDQLVNLVGELVIAQTRLSRLAIEKDDPALAEIAETIERLSNDLRENTLDIRMLPIGASFGKFKRVVWDLSSQRGKTVELVTEGAATELDKTVIERLDDPLVHLLRNSIDHGIEPTEERRRAGKPPQGKIIFSAEHSGGHVIITISDDGRGIDPDAVRAKAVERGLLNPDATPDEKELFNFIFEPGFSTASQVTDLSGRGVGMDVVKQSITALRGKVTVASEKGRGTTVTMKLPLTLAIIDGLQVRIGGENFIVPLAVVSECLELAGGKNGSRENRLINLRDQLVPFLNLREWFSISGSPPGNEQVVIVSSEKALVGLVVDEVIGLQQTVIKNLGAAYKDIKGISGATIQGDGSIALILDVDLLVQEAEERAGTP
ncbi:MAG: chemotaxis protein CheA [Thermodesulfobacteriota bacterium]